MIHRRDGEQSVMPGFLVLLQQEQAGPWAGIGIYNHLKQLRHLISNGPTGHGTWPAIMPSLPRLPFITCKYSAQLGHFLFTKTAE
jgi:hypothetical protein